MSEPSARIPVSILTGFLGSGKTTLLLRLLERPQLRRTAVLVNEFGDVGIDDLLLNQLTSNVVLLKSGCICCTIGQDVGATLIALLEQSRNGSIPGFDRAIVETTGLADPGPILQRFMTEPLRSAPFSMAGVIVTVDALNAARQLDEHVEPCRQVAIADRILITKTDLADRHTVTRLVDGLRGINPGAPIHETSQGRIEPELILDAGLWNPASGKVDPDRWLSPPQPTRSPYRPVAQAPEDAVQPIRAAGRHGERIDTFYRIWDAPISFQSIADLLEDLVARYGDDLLRIKGILNVVESDTPVVVHGVQHVFHPPLHLSAWPTSDRRSKLVFITRNIERTAIEPLLAAIAPPANPPSC